VYEGTSNENVDDYLINNPRPDWFMGSENAWLNRCKDLDSESPSKDYTEADEKMHNLHIRSLKGKAELAERWANNTLTDQSQGLNTDHLPLSNNAGSYESSDTTSSYDSSDHTGTSSEGGSEVAETSTNPVDGSEVAETSDNPVGGSSYAETSASGTANNKPKTSSSDGSSNDS
jgi:hypothetical protein